MAIIPLFAEFVASDEGRAAGNFAFGIPPTVQEVAYTLTSRQEHNTVLAHRALDSSFVRCPLAVAFNFTAL